MIAHSQDQNLKIAAKISLVPLVILLIGAFVFYKERIIFDGAYISFQIINTGALQIQAERYGSFITQLFPLIASKCHLSLQAVLISYSASFSIFYLATALILYRLRAYTLVVLTAFYFTLYVSDTYFWTNCELHQGICWMLLVFGLVYYDTQSTRQDILTSIFRLALFVVLTFLAIYTHPTVMIPYGFLWGYYVIDQWKLKTGNRKIIIESLLIAAIIVFKYLTSTKNSYDNNFLAKLEKVNIQDVLNTFSSGLADTIWKGYISNYWFIPILFITGLVALCKKKKFLLLAFFVIANLAFFVILCLMFSGGEKFYIESELMPFSILGCAPFIFEVLPTITTKRRVSLVLCFIFAVRLAYISLSAPKFTGRLHKVETMLSTIRNGNLSKIIVTHNDTDWRLEHDLILGWALPYETIYLSALNGDTLQRTIMYCHENRLQEFEKEDTHQRILFPFGSLPNSDLNKYYFHMDTTQGYTNLKYEELYHNK